MKITFIGAAKCVTGSCYLVEAGKTKFLIDCGMFQGLKEVKERNYGEFDFNPAEIEFVLLTHAHIDHSGLIPKLFKKGFKGKIIATSATVELSEVMLPDSGHIQETECERKNKKYLRRGQKLIEPIYTAAEAHNCLKHFKRIDYDILTEVNENLKFCFRNSGHILGSALVELYYKDKDSKLKVVFTGDIGNKNQPIVKDPHLIEETDYLIIESTYGNKIHEIRDITKKREQLKNIILNALKKGGNIIVPAFAVERTQDLLVELNILLKNNELPQFPIIIDSPLAISATEIFQRHHQYFSDRVMEMNKDGGKALIFDKIRFTKTAEESQELNNMNEQAMIISASGMCDAGRIKHHLKHNLWRNEATILMTGYQAEGTLGRRLIDGEKIVRIHGDSVMVKADVIKLEGFSGHIDNPGMLEWLSALKTPPKKIFIVHGEEEQQKGLEKSIRDNLKFETLIPSSLETVFLKDKAVIEEQALQMKYRTSEAYFEQYRAVKQNLKELMKLRLNENQIEELYEDLKTIEKVSRRFLAIK
ncbi:MBL fold metallo-hydrolase [Candidatus Dependentiae bacterium]|nr:MBL fold metallo-hydrolase [Candidatus Dependentiae bacterium]